MGERDRIRAGVGVGEGGGNLTAGGDIPQIGVGLLPPATARVLPLGLNASEYAFALPKVLVQSLAAISHRQICAAAMASVAPEGLKATDGMRRWCPAEREIDWDTLVAWGGLHQVDDLNAAAGFGDDDLGVDGAVGQRDGQARLRAGAGRGHGPGAGRDGRLRTHGAGRRIGGDVTGGSRSATAVERHLALIDIGLDHPHQGFTCRCGQVVVDDPELPLLGGSPEGRHRIRATSMHDKADGPDGTTRRGSPGGAHLDAVIARVNGVIGQYRPVGDAVLHELRAGTAGRIQVHVHQGRSLRQVTEADPPETYGRRASGDRGTRGGRRARGTRRTRRYQGNSYRRGQGRARQGEHGEAVAADPGGYQATAARGALNGWCAVAAGDGNRRPT